MVWVVNRPCCPVKWGSNKHPRTEHQGHTRLHSAVAPYDPDPGVAAEHCFDRETGESVRPELLKSYRQAVAQYHLHPEIKFLGGNYCDHGLLERRHVTVGDVEHIGKEANRWEEQFATGEDPDAQIRYGTTGEQSSRIAAELREACSECRRRELAQACHLTPPRPSLVFYRVEQPRPRRWKS